MGQMQRIFFEQGLVHIAHDRGQTPLGGGVFKGFADIAKLLVEAGADLDADNGGGMTPLLYAKMFGRTKVARCLEKLGANTKAKNRYDRAASAC